MPRNLYLRITGEIIGAGLQVYKELGPGLGEFDYQKAMNAELSSRGVGMAPQAALVLTHRGVRVDEFRCDLLVEGKVIAEIKVLDKSFAPEHFVQILCYLKRWGLGVGQLLNFGLHKFYNRRVLYDPAAPAIHLVGPWRQLRARADGQVLDKLDDAIRLIAQQYGVGYRDTTYKSLLKVELNHRGLAMSTGVAAIQYEGTPITERRELNAFVVGRQLLLMVLALYDDTSASDLARALGYMKHLGLQAGIIVLFSPKEIIVRAVCPSSKNIR